MLVNDLSHWSIDFRRPKFVLDVEDRWHSLECQQRNRCSDDPQINETNVMAIALIIRKFDRHDLAAINFERVCPPVQEGTFISKEDCGVVGVPTVNSIPVGAKNLIR